MYQGRGGEVPPSRLSPTQEFTIRGLSLNLGDAFEIGLLDFVPSTTRKLTVKFPREGIDITYRGTSEEEKARYPADKKHMTWFDVILGKDASVSVEGFGIPYSNPDHPAEGSRAQWIQRRTRSIAFSAGV